MYEMLLRADLVIADISTGNVNAVYELGVRHALRPNSTIVMKEQEGRLHFDLNHISTFHYKHLGEDIGAREANRAREVLSQLIGESIRSQNPDSPVYTYLPKLQRPRLSDEEYAELLDEAEESQEKLSAYIHQGEAASKLSQHGEAVRTFGLALALKPSEPYLLQMLALSTYKSEKPTKVMALLNGLQIIAQLNPEKSNDPETLGITGAIHKRLWLHTFEREHIDAAIRYYGRGFEIRRDYYNGENLATCYDMRCEIHSDPDEVLFDRMSARKVRISIIAILGELVISSEYEERSDRKWIQATLANCHFALGHSDLAKPFELAFFAENPAQWQITTYLEGKKVALKVSAIDNRKRAES